MMKTKNFCAFILTHGRADRVHTYNLLKRKNYTGRIILIVDDEDNQLPEYKKKYGNEVLVFNKEKIAQTFDSFENFPDRRAIVYARNYCFEIAEKLGIKYFIQLDDDYTSCHFRFDQDGNYTSKEVADLDRIFDVLVTFYKNTGALSIAMAQGGDFMGGREAPTIFHGIKIKRKAMNTLICSTERKFQFIGRINEDVNTYVNLGSRGHLFFTVMQVCIEQMATQGNPGGMAELYLESGTYIKSFYPIICNPSSVKIMLMGRTDMRLHHKILWKYTVPKILNEKHRKTGKETK